MELDFLLEGQKDYGDDDDGDRLVRMDRDALMDVVEVISVELMDFLDRFDSYDWRVNVIENMLVMRKLLLLLLLPLLMSMKPMLASMNDVMMMMRKRMWIFLIDDLSIV